MPRLIFTVSEKHFNYKVKQKLVPSKKKRNHILLTYCSEYNVPRNTQNFLIRVKQNSIHNVE